MDNQEILAVLDNMSLEINSMRNAELKSDSLNDTVIKLPESLPITNNISYLDNAVNYSLRDIREGGFHYAFYHWTFKDLIVAIDIYQV